jgi:hypothetical protein
VEHENHKHVIKETELAAHQRFVRRTLSFILDLSAMELVIAIVHCALTAYAIFIATGGGH